LVGFQKNESTNGIQIYKVKAWDYAGMCEVFETAIQAIRETHTPAIFHVEEVTQPQGHSTSGSHERYKSADRLQWEREWDGIKKMKEWIIENALASEEELNEIDLQVKEQVKSERALAWEKYLLPIRQQIEKTVDLLQAESDVYPSFNLLASELKSFTGATPKGCYENPCSGN
jgi:TPP-dependent pyruvate/acetoin dehydrogenase alpha subunit